MESVLAHPIAAVLDLRKLKAGSTSLPTAILIGIVIILAIRSIIFRLQRAYGSTLRHVPGPWHAKFTDVALRYHDVMGDRFYWITDLHKKYGPYVRTGPEEVAVCDPAAVKTIHGLGTEFRKRQLPGQNFNIFSMSDPKAHRTRQRFFVNAFSNDRIKASHRPAVLDLCHRFIDSVREDAANNPNHSTDMYKWCMLFGYDVASEVVFGNSSTNGLMAQGKGVNEVMMGCYLQLQAAWMQFSFPTWQIARWLTPVFPSLSEIFRVEWRYRNLWEETQRQKDMAARTTFVRGAAYDETDGKYQLEGGLRMRAFDIAKDCQTFLGAGGEPIGATLVYLIWTVLQDPVHRNEIETEVKCLQEPLLDTEVEAKCPVLEGTIYEALRLYGGGLTCLPRFAPTPQVVGPYTLPPGTCVAWHAFALHRNPTAWEDPEKFDPKRWMKPGQSKALQTDAFQPFSSGARGCIAIHLVMTELRLFCGTFFRELPNLSLGPSVTEKSMRISDRFHFAPVSKSLEVILPEERS